MSTTPTAEEFLASTDPDEDDQEPEHDVTVPPGAGCPGCPVPSEQPIDIGYGASLVSISDSLRQIVDVMTGGGGPAQLIADLEAEVTQIEALHDTKQTLIEEVLLICKPSTSKLANSIRAVLEPAVTVPVAEPDGVPAAVQCPACERYFADQALLDAHVCEATHPVVVPTAQPAHDGYVEDWRAYARSCGFTGSDVDTMNRAQIRTMLGIPQPAPAE